MRNMVEGIFRAKISSPSACGWSPPREMNRCGLLPAVRSHAGGMAANSSGRIFALRPLWRSS